MKAQTSPSGRSIRSRPHSSRHTQHHCRPTTRHQSRHISISRLVSTVKNVITPSSTTSLFEKIDPPQSSTRLSSNTESTNEVLSDDRFNRPQYFTIPSLASGFDASLGVIPQYTSHAQQQHQQKHQRPDQMHEKHQHGDQCSHSCDTTTANSQSSSPNLPQGTHHKHHSQQSTANISKTQHINPTTTTQKQHHVNKVPPLTLISPVERKAMQLLAGIPHPETGQDLVFGDHITQVKLDPKTHTLTIRVKLDKSFRTIKQSIQQALQHHITIGNDIPDDYNHFSSAPNHTLRLKTVQISIAETQDDPTSTLPLSTPVPSVPTSVSPLATSTQNKPSKLQSVHVASPTSSSSYLAQQQHEQQQLAERTGSGARGLSQVKKVLFVYSGKGGVGKSSVAVNLAVALSQTPYIDDANPIPTKSSRNLRIGLFDADLYGPSLPSLIDISAIQQGALTGQGLEITKDNTSQSADLLQDEIDGQSMIRPVLCNDVKLMSYGYVTRTKGGGHGGSSKSSSGDTTGPAPAIMRGGMVAPLVQELLTRTNWGELDVLVIDMPPGTSDIHITLTQQVHNASAVIVSTPSRLSYVDVLRGLQLLDQTNVPSIALVQNMAYFQAPTDPTGTKYPIFGNLETFREKIQTLGSIPYTVDLPILPSIADSADQGIPLTFQYLSQLQTWVNFHSHNLQQHSSASFPTSASSIDSSTTDSLPPLAQPTAISNSPYSQSIQQTLSHYAQLAHAVQYWIQPQRHARLARPNYTLSYDPDAHRLLIRNTIENEHPGVISPTDRYAIDPYDTRLACVCAACKHEYSGVSLIDPTKIPADVKPTAIQPRGSYAVAVQWSDGHSSSIYTWDQLHALSSSPPKV